MLYVADKQIILTLTHPLSMLSVNCANQCELNLARLCSKRSAQIPASAILLRDSALRTESQLPHHQHLHRHHLTLLDRPRDEHLITRPHSLASYTAGIMTTVVTASPR